MKKTFKPLDALISAALTVACCGARIYGLYPFGVPMFCALGGAPMCAPVYLLCSFLFTFELWRLYAAAAAVFIMAARWLLALHSSKFDRPAAFAVFSVSAIAAESALMCIFRPVTEAAINFAAGLGFLCFARIAALSASRRFAFKPAATDALALCVVAAAFGLTLGTAKAGGAFVGLGLAAFAVWFISTAGGAAALAAAFSIALGMSFDAGIEVAFSFIVSTGVFVGFYGLPRIVRHLSAVGAFVAAYVLFGAELERVLYDGIAMAAGGLAFAVIPRRAVRALTSYFDYDGSARLAVRHYINRTRADAGNKMLCVASVFDETARLFGTIKPDEPDAAALGRVMADKFCPYCPRLAECNGAAAIDAFTKLAELACAGKHAITDLPEFFTDGCIKAADIVGEAEKLSDSARARAAGERAESSAKSIVIERLNAIKDVLNDIGDRQAQPVGFDADAEDRIIFELGSRGIECAEAFVTRDGVTAVVRSAAADRRAIARAVTVALGRGAELAALEKTQAAGWSVATLKKKPAFEAVYARAGVSKSGGVSGDSYTFKRIGDRFLVALADGMGTGERAGPDSDAAVELIECFYRAGFDSASVLSGVNRFLKLPATESYSAADVVVCDLDSAAVDIIKLGAPPCYIKTADTVLKIEGSSLPLGVLDEMRPFVTAKRMYPGQMLFLATDGVSDCFGGDELPEFINGLNAVNPEAAATAVLRRALRKVGDVPRDDMTVIAVRLFNAHPMFRRNSSKALA